MLLKPLCMWCWWSFLFQMLLSVVLAVLGFAGGTYCVVISSLGLMGGPLCDTGDGEYLYPFRNNTLEWVWLPNLNSSNFAFPNFPLIFLYKIRTFPKWTDGLPCLHLNSHSSEYHVAAGQFFDQGIISGKTAWVSFVVLAGSPLSKLHQAFKRLLSCDSHWSQKEMFDNYIC